METKIEVHTDASKMLSAPKLAACFVSANSLFPTQASELHITNNEQLFEVEILLNEWLLALTEFMRLCEQENRVKFSKELIFSGEKFVGRLESDEYRLTVFDLRTQTMVELAFHQRGIRLLHSRLFDEFIRLGRAIIGESAEIEGLSSYSWA